MKRLIIFLGKIFLNFIYLFFKVFPTKKQIVYISMQSDNKSLDFKLLSEKIEKRDSTIKQVFLCKKMKSGLEKTTDYISYVFNMISYSFKAMYYLSTSRLCITESYCVPISILKHKKQLKIIQIWHASGAVKKFGYQILDKGEGKASRIAKAMCMHKNYDYVIAPSEETKKVFSEAFNISQEKIIKLGLPRLEYISDPKYDRTEEFYKDYPNYRNKKIILYVPTFRKGKNIDLTEIKNYNLDKYKYRMIIRLHPLENASIPDECDINSKYSTYDLIKIADYIITDYSILSVEASLLNKPIFLYLYDLDDYNKNRGLNIDLPKELKTFTTKSFGDIMNKIENNDYNMEEIRKFRNKYIDINTENTTSELAQFILSLCDGKEKRKKGYEI